MAVRKCMQLGFRQQRRAPRGGPAGCAATAVEKMHAAGFLAGSFQAAAAAALPLTQVPLTSISNLPYCLCELPGIKRSVAAGRGRAQTQEPASAGVPPKPRPRQRRGALQWPCYCLVRAPSAAPCPGSHASLAQPGRRRPAAAAPLRGAASRSTCCTLHELHNNETWEVGMRERGSGSAGLVLEHGHGALGAGARVVRRRTSPAGLAVQPSHLYHAIAVVPPGVAAAQEFLKILRAGRQVGRQAGGCSRRPRHGATLAACDPRHSRAAASPQRAARCTPASSTCRLHLQTPSSRPRLTSRAAGPSC